MWVIVEGRSIVTYTIDEQLGFGKCANVFKASTSVGEVVAIRDQHSFLKSKEEDGFYIFSQYVSPQEAEEHYLMPAYQVIERTNGRMLSISKFYEGENAYQGLFEKLDSLEDWQLFFLRFAHDIAIAVTFLHEKGLRHGDVKMSNVVATKKQYILLDFQSVKPGRQEDFEEDWDKYAQAISFIGNRGQLRGYTSIEECAKKVKKIARDDNLSSGDKNTQIQTILTEFGVLNVG
jgi:serine/threonine protein kinase